MTISIRVSTSALWGSRQGVFARPQTEGAIVPDLLTLDPFDLAPGTCGTCGRDLFLFTFAAWDVHLAECRPPWRGLQGEACLAVP
jgi:hypothetical protein